MRFKDSLTLEQNKTQIANVEAKRDLELKDKDIIIRDEQLQVASLKAEIAAKQKLIFIASIILLLLVSGISFKWFWDRNKRHVYTLKDISDIHSHDIRGPVARILGLLQIQNKKTNLEINTLKSMY